MNNISKYIALLHMGVVFLLGGYFIYLLLFVGGIAFELF